MVWHIFVFQRSCEVVVRSFCCLAVLALFGFIRGVQESFFALAYRIWLLFGAHYNTDFPSSLVFTEQKPHKKTKKTCFSQNLLR